jgi:pimeloyl-ACP methyl ester carboxylesterase
MNIQEYEGKLIVYDAEECLIGFKNARESKNVIIYIAGMHGRLLQENVPRKLYEYCNKNDISFYQPMLRSHPHYGLYTLVEDMEDLEKVINSQPRRKYILVGFSTGCQSILYFLKNSRSENIKNILFCVLQGPISDREFEESNNKDLESQLEVAYNTDGILPFTSPRFPITSTRFRDLYAKHGRDDILSSDLDDSLFIELNRHNIPLYFVICEKDEYAVKDNSHKLSQIRRAKILRIENADHGINGEKEVEDFMRLFDGIYNSECRL